MNKEMLVEELRYSLPSQRMLNVVHIGAVEINGELIYLKKREGVYPNHFIKWDRNEGWQYDYNELCGKNVIFSLSLFNSRGKEAILKFLENNI